MVPFRTLIRRASFFRCAARSDVPISLRSARWGHFWESASSDVQRCKKADGQIARWSTVGKAENRPINGRLLSALQALIVELNSDVILK